MQSALALMAPELGGDSSLHLASVVKLLITVRHGAPGGTEDMLRGFVHSFEADPSALLGAFPPLPLPAALRHSALVSLQAAVKARTAKPRS